MNRKRLDRIEFGHAFSMVLPDVKAINYMKRNFEIRVAFWKEGIESYIRHINSCFW